jgi:hypothetical protein
MNRKANYSHFLNSNAADCHENKFQVATQFVNKQLNVPQEAKASVFHPEVRQCQTIHMSNNEKQGWLVLAG